MERSAAEYELKRKSEWSTDMAVGLTLIFFGGLGITRFLNVFDSRGLCLFGDLINVFGVGMLASTLTRKKNTCSGLSLKSLQLTALHLAVKLYYGFLGESYGRAFHIYSILGTLWAIYLVGYKYKSGYVDHQDNLKMSYLVASCALLSLVIHPVTPDNLMSGITVAFCCYLNCISMLPQLQVMRRREIVEPHTARYIFFMGCQRLVYAENWVIEILLTRGQSLTFLGSTYVGYNNIFWAFMAVLSEIVNGLILADFCFYFMFVDCGGEDDDMHLPSGVV